MDGKTHAIVGVSFALLLQMTMPEGFVVLDNNIKPALTLVPALAGAIIPDWDLLMLRLSKKKDLGSKIVTGVHKAANKVTPDSVSQMTSHRGITHTLLFPALFMVALFLLPQYFVGAFATVIASAIFGLVLGWISHIFADIFNGKGVPLLWPVVSKKIHIMTVTSGTWQEFVWLICYLLVVSYLMNSGVSF